MSELSDILRRVNALLAQADHPNTGVEEANTFRAKAEAMMVKYRIEETQLSAAERQQMGVTVQWLDMDICEYTSEYRVFYYDLIRSVVAHMDVRMDFIRTVGRNTGDLLTHGTRDDGVETWATVSVCGFESDLLFVQALYTNARLAFSSKMEPKYDPSLSDQVNAYLMRSAGMEGWRIAQAIYGKTDKALRPKVRKMFEAEAIARGEDPKPLLGRGSNMKLFRESYASGFVSEYRSRLYFMRASRGAGEVGLVLANRKDQIDEAFYARFPDRRPQPIPQIGEANPKRCERCAKAKSGYCRDHAWMRPRKQRARYANSTAYARGVSAARAVDLGGPKEVR